VSPAEPGRPGDEALSFDVSVEEHACVVRVSGDIDITTAEWLRTRLLELADEGHVNQVLSLEGEVFLDSAGLGAVVSIRRRLQKLGGALVLACSNDLVLRLLRLTSLDKVVAIHPTAQEALEHEFVD
jgi:anti-sigma B factor antagonist